MNIPQEKLGIVAVSRDCFPIELSRNRRENVAAECSKLGLDIFQAPTVVENEKDVLKALEELKGAGVNALVIYLGNFGPEGPESMLAQKFDGPTMFVAAAEEHSDGLIGGRGDAYCGMLNASYNAGLRKIKPYIPEYPVGIPVKVAKMIIEFCDISRVLLGIGGLKIFAFGPRPQDFLACNAPIKALYDLGVEIQENSELDLFASFNAHKDDPRIPAVVADMAAELGSGNGHPGVLDKLAQYEVTLMDWYENNLGASTYGIFANKCWPAFQTQFGFVPCYVNSRLASRGIPVACETDIYGALSEYILTCASRLPATLLDINNTVPADIFDKNKGKLRGYTNEDLFMGFHCGNTPICMLKKGEMKHQLIMHRLLEPDSEPNITRGTLEGDIKEGEITLFRLQSTADTRLTSYIAEGIVPNVATQSFGAIGIFAIKDMARFYRYVLIKKRYPHHAGVGFAHLGKTLFNVLTLLGVEDIEYNRPAGNLYEGENPFK